MSHSFSVAFVLQIALVAQAAGCSTSGDEGQEQAPVQSKPSDPASVPSKPSDPASDPVDPVLPRFADEEDCEEISSRTLCEWALSFDGIVVGTVAGVEALTSPVVLSSSGDVTEECPAEAWLNIGLTIELEQTTVLRGSLEDAKLGALAIGPQTRSYWAQSFSIDSDGKLIVDAVPGEENVFPVGSRVGAPVNIGPDGVLYLQWEPPFGVDRSGDVVAPLHAPCSRTPELDGLSLQTLEASLLACEEDDEALAAAVALRELRNNGSSTEAGGTYAALCREDRDDPVVAECGDGIVQSDRDEDCDDGNRVSGDGCDECQLE
jgi:cysteine-rich repeat protein